MSKQHQAEQAVEQINEAYASWVSAYGCDGVVAKLLVNVAALMAAVNCPGMGILEGQEFKSGRCQNDVG